jgi:hypothetical protein
MRVWFCAITQVTKPFRPAPLCIDYEVIRIDDELTKAAPIVVGVWLVLATGWTICPAQS